MRTIKFRVWDAKYNCYMQTDKWGISYVAAGGRGYSLHTVIINETLTDKIHEEIAFNGTNPRWTVEQFTGFKDKNGKEIYEGDIFNSTAVYYKWDPVEFKNGMFQANLRGARIYSLSELFENDIINYYTVEVIGNIHENPELIP